MKKRTLLVTSAALATAALLPLLSGCAAPKVAEYAAEKPVLDLREYFNGPLSAHGMFQDRSGKVIKRFTVAMQGTWKGDVGTLEEDFSYSDGTTQRRVWTLTRGADGQYTGRADDVVGEATGQARGNAFHWQYTLQQPVDGKVYDVQMDDWMFLIDDKRMLNRTEMRKFGIRLGDVTVSFTKK